MLIRLGYDLTFQVPSRSAMLLMLYVHPSQAPSLVEVDRVQVVPYAPVEEFIDTFGNRCGRLVVPPGKLRLWNTALIRDSGALDAVCQNAWQQPIEALPARPGRSRLPVQMQPALPGRLTFLTIRASGPQA
jgi:hypothetical protein